MERGNVDLNSPIVADPAQSGDVPAGFLWLKKRAPSPGVSPSEHGPEENPPVVYPGKEPLRC